MAINVSAWRDAINGAMESMKTDNVTQISRATDDNRNVMLYWDDANPFPPDIIAVKEKWQNFCPGWDVALFGKETACSFLQDNFGGDIARLFLTCGLPNMRSDFFRVFWGISRGGIYSDILLVPKREPLFFDPGKNLTLGRNLTTGIPINGFFFAKKDCAELKLVAYQLITAISKREIRRIFSLTGPAAWTIALWGRNAGRMKEMGTSEMITSTIAIVDLEDVWREYLDQQHYPSSKRGTDMHWSSLQRYTGLYRRTEHLHGKLS